MVIHSEKCSDKAPKSNKEKKLMPQSEVFKEIMEEIRPIPSNTEEKSLEQWEEEENRRVLKNRELEESLGIAWSKHLFSPSNIPQLDRAESFSSEEELYFQASTSTVASLVQQQQTNMNTKKSNNSYRLEFQSISSMTTEPPTSRKLRHSLMLLKK